MPEYVMDQGPEKQERYRAEKLETAQEALKKFIVWHIINAQEAREDLYMAMNFGHAAAPKIKAYQNFLTAFSALFMAVRHNIRRSKRIKDWVDKKEPAYQKFLEENTQCTEINMEASLKLFTEMVEDLTKSGIYSLTEEISIINEGFDEG